MLLEYVENCNRIKDIISGRDDVGKTWKEYFEEYKDKLCIIPEQA